MRDYRPPERSDRYLIDTWRESPCACHHSGRTIDDGEMIEPTNVVWLTAGQYFADIREFHGTIEPHDLDKTQAFSGRIAVEGDVVSWHHDLDMMARPDGHADANPVVGTRDDLIEVGENYEEFWHRVDSGKKVRGVAQFCVRDAADVERTIARVVLVDDRAIAIWSIPQPGAALFEDNDGWEISTVVGPGYSGDLVPIVSGLATGGDLAPDWSVVSYRD